MPINQGNLVGRLAKLESQISRHRWPDDDDVLLVQINNDPALGEGEASFDLPRGWTPGPQDDAKNFWLPPILDGEHQSLHCPASIFRREPSESTEAFQARLRREARKAGARVVIIGGPRRETSTNSALQSDI